MIIFSDEIKNALISEIKKAKDSVQIVTAYCKLSTLELIDAHIASSVQIKRVLVRFRLDDILNCATDFSICDFCLSNGWQLYIRLDLHAKTYIVDNQRVLIGSAI